MTTESTGPLTDLDLARLSAEVARVVDGAKWWANEYGRTMLTSGEEIGHTWRLMDCEPTDNQVLTAVTYFDYASDRNRAMDLLERVGETRAYDIYREQRGYIVVIQDENPRRGVVTDPLPTLPVAICRAVLAAVQAGVWVPGKEGE